MNDDSDAGSISQQQFESLKEAFFQASGIEITEGKVGSILSRLKTKVKVQGYVSLDQFVDKLRESPSPEDITFLTNFFTVNETFFFREKGHFDFLKEHMRKNNMRSCQVWSAASSTGEEAFTIAVNLSEILGVKGLWQVFATDLSDSAVSKAKAGIYPMDRLENFPENLLKKYCLKGKDEYEGRFTFIKPVRNKVHFHRGNLMESFPFPEKNFDFIFLRNVLIYFKEAEKTKILNNVLFHLKKNGVLITGHAEMVQHPSLENVIPNIYIKRS